MFDDKPYNPETIDEIRHIRQIRHRLETDAALLRIRLREALQKGHEEGLSVAEMARAAGIAHASASRIIHHGRSWQPRRAA